MDYQLTPSIYEIVKQELDKRGVRWQQRHRQDVDIIAEIYAEKIYDPVFKAKSEELQNREEQLKCDESIFEMNRKMLEEDRKKLEEDRMIFEKEKGTVFPLTEQQKQINAFAKSISNFYAVLHTMRVPEFYVEQVTSVLHTYIKEVKEP